MRALQNGVDTGAFSPALLGWGWLTAWGLVSLALKTPPIPGGPAVANAATSASALVGLGLLAIMLRYKPRLTAAVRLQRKAVAWGLGLFMAACSLGNQLLQAPWAAMTPAAVALQVVSSFAYVGLMALWFLAYAVRDPQVVESGAIWSTVLCAAVVALVHLLPYGVGVGVWVLLPLASVACLVRVGISSGSQSAHRSAASAGIPVLVRTFAGIAICGLVLALPPNLATVVALANRGSLLLGMLGGVVLAAVLVLGYTAATRYIGLRSLFGWLQPVAVVGLFCAAVPLVPTAIAGIVLASAGQWALYVFVWIYAAEAPRQRLGEGLGVYIGARAAFDGGGGLAALFSWGFLEFAGPGLAHELLVYVLFGAVALLVLVGSLGIPLGPAAKDAVEGALTQPKPEQTFDDLVNERAHAVTERFGLSEREAQILVRLLRGYSTAAIRNELGVAKGTVDTYISRIYRKCAVHGRQELVELAERQQASGPSR